MHRRKTAPIDDDFQEILVSAVRYALGRMTYIVGLTVDYIMPMIQNLKTKYINIMIDDITYQGEYYGYGMEMDRKDWMRLLAGLKAERDRRLKDGSDG